MRVPHAPVLVGSDDFGPVVSEDADAGGRFYGKRRAERIFGIDDHVVAAENIIESFLLLADDATVENDRGAGRQFDCP